MLYAQGQGDPDLGNSYPTSTIGCLLISPFGCLEIHQLHGVRKSPREETGLFTGKLSDNHNYFHRHLRPHLTFVALAKGPRSGEQDTDCSKRKDN